MPTEHLSDFSSVPWAHSLLCSPDIEILPQPSRRPPVGMRSVVSNSMFAKTLHTDSAIRAMVNFRRRAARTDASADLPYPWEYCMLFSVGDGVDGKIGRAHGGFNALLMDQVTGFASSQVMSASAGDGEPPATANLNMDYRAPIPTPCLVLCRATILSVEGRKVRVKGVIEDGRGTIFAEGTVLYILPRGRKL